MQVNKTEKLNNDLETQKDHNQVMPLGCKDWRFSRFCLQVLICGIRKYCRKTTFDFLHYARALVSNISNTCDSARPLFQHVDINFVKNILLHVLFSTLENNGAMYM